MIFTKDETTPPVIYAKSGVTQVLWCFANASGVTQSVVMYANA